MSEKSTQIETLKQEITRLERARETYQANINQNRYWIRDVNARLEHEYGKLEALQQGQLDFDGYVNGVRNDDFAAPEGDEFETITGSLSHRRPDPRASAQHR